MKQKPRYFTYITRLWLASLFCPPLAFLLFTLMVDSRLFNNAEEPLLFALYYLLAFIFTIPTVLFIILSSFIIPRISQQPRKMKIITIIMMMAGVLATFVIVYQAGSYSAEQLLWGVTMGVFYSLGIAAFGWNIPL